jgi:hypothetical protein
VGRKIALVDVYDFRNIAKKESEGPADIGDMNSHK